MALQMILQTGIVEELVAESGTEHKFPLLDRLSRKATTLTPLDHLCALWAISTWGMVLGVIKNA